VAESRQEEQRRCLAIENGLAAALRNPNTPTNAAKRILAKQLTPGVVRKALDGNFPVPANVTSGLTAFLKHAVDRVGSNSIALRCYWFSDELPMPEGVCDTRCQAGRWTSICSTEYEDVAGVWRALYVALESDATRPQLLAWVRESKWDIAALSVAATARSGDEARWVIGNLHCDAVQVLVSEFSEETEIAGLSGMERCPAAQLKRKAIENRHTQIVQAAKPQWSPELREEQSRMNTIDEANEMADGVLLSRYLSGSDRELRMAAAYSPHLPLDSLLPLVKDRDPYMRRAVAIRTGIPEAVARELLDDVDSAVRLAAIDNPSQALTALLQKAREIPEFDLSGLSDSPSDQGLGSSLTEEQFHSRGRYRELMSAWERYGKRTTTGYRENVVSKIELKTFESCLE
jgi:hypothetical protein